jgi:L-serine/L-threonine ammonia-lyase
METPCILSRELSLVAGCNIYLKLENLQPSGSFKSRGIGALMHRTLLSLPTGKAHFYCSSGGNAGLACAEAARTLGQPCDVFVSSLTPEHILVKLARLGATPHRVGNSWPESDAHCQTVAAGDPEGIYVPPFDDPLIWDGNATLVDELAALEAKGGFFVGEEGGGNGTIDAIVCNVGGGGLLNGIMQGVERNYDYPGWHSTADINGKVTNPESSDNTFRRPVVLALETVGADSLAASIRVGVHVGIPAITSVAISLGAPRVSSQTYEWARLCGATTSTFSSTSTPAPTKTTKTTNGKPQLLNVVVTDADAVSACARFLDDARLLVEVACGATIASAYNPDLLRGALGPDMDDESWARMNVVLVVCGGSSISMDMLAEYRKKFGV